MAATDITNITSITQLGASGVLALALATCWKYIKVKDTRIQEVEDKLLDLTQKSIIAYERNTTALDCLVKQCELIVKHSMSYTSKQEQEELEQKVRDLLADRTKEL